VNLVARHLKAQRLTVPSEDEMFKQSEHRAFVTHVHHQWFDLNPFSIVAARIYSTLLKGVF
jgi:hypothetical protein